MNDFLNSKFMFDLKEGKLPAVTIDNFTIAKLGAMFIIVAVVVLLVNGIVQKTKG
jgi:hypothetical protein